MSWNMTGTSVASAARRRSIAILPTGEVRHIIGAPAPRASQFRRWRPDAALSASTDSIQSVGSGDILPQTLEPRSRMKPRTASAAPSAADQAPSAGRARAAEPSPPPAAAGRLSLAIVALSEDPLLLEALTAAAIGQAAVCTSPSADRFADQLVANAAAVALIDAAVAPAPLDEFIANVHRQFPQLLVLLAGPALLQNQFAAQLADGTIFRFAHKPASAQRLKLFVDAALLRRQSVVEQAMLAPVAGGNLTAANLTGANLTGANLTGANLTGGPNPFGNSGSRRPFWVVTSIFVLLIAAAVGAVLWRRPLMSLVQAPSSGEATPGAQSSPAAAPPSADLAAQAAEAERESID